MEPHAFETPDGIPVTAVTADEMRAVDRIAVTDLGLDLPVMMENAGRNLADRVAARDPPTVTVLAGNGGNGGGGLAGARHLANRDIGVEVRLDRPPRGLDGAAGRQLDLLEAMAVTVDVGPADWDPGGVVVDAIVGYGVTGPLRGTAAALVRRLEESTAPVISLDVPTGVDASTGEAFKPHVTADEVLTLALPKTGLQGQSTQLTLADIGLPATVYGRLGIDYTTPFAGGAIVPLEPVGTRV